MSDIIDTIRFFDRVSASHTRGSDGKAQALLFDKGKVELRVVSITERFNAINDSFYLNSTTNGVLDVNVLGDRRTTTTTITTTINI